MLAIAAGGSTTELGYVKQEFPIPFPIIRDTQYEIHKLLGEPRTPFTLLIDRKGKVLFAHLGVIEDMESFFNKIAALAALIGIGRNTVLWGFRKKQGKHRVRRRPIGSFTS